MSLSGLAPPIYCKSSNSSYVEKKLKFKKKHSAGLRIRIHPSLQSEEIGIISQEEIVTYIGEVSDLIYYLFFSFFKFVSIVKFKFT